MNEIIKNKIDKEYFNKKEWVRKYENLDERLNFKRRILFLKKGKEIKNKNLTFISNNCIATNICYDFGIEPYAMLERIWIEPNDYLKFLANLKYYISLEPEVICDRNYYIVIRLGDINICHNHSNNLQYVLNSFKKEKIYYDNLFILFDSVYINKKDELNLLNKFQKLPYKNKLYITGNVKLKDYKDVFYIKNFDTYKYKRFVKNDNIVMSIDNIDFLKWFNGKNIK